MTIETFYLKFIKLPLKLFLSHWVLKFKLGKKSIIAINLLLTKKNTINIFKSTFLCSRKISNNRFPINPQYIFCKFCNMVEII